MLIAQEKHGIRPLRLKEGTMKKLVLVVLLAFFTSSCATLFKGDTATVTFTSNPSQANVLIDGNSIGQTTTQARLKTNRSYNVTTQQPKVLNSVHSPRYLS